MTETHDCPYCGESFDSKQGVRIHEGYMHDLPYKDEETMRRLYVEEQMSFKDIAEKFDVGTTTIEEWLKKHGIERRDFGGKPSDAAYKDAELLRELYREKDMTRDEIAEKLDCTVGDVRYHLEKNDIQKKPKPWHDPEKLRQKCEVENVFVPDLAKEWGCGETTIYYHLYKHGIERPRFAKEKVGKSIPYQTIWHQEDGQRYAVYVHRLVACAHGMIDTSEVYSGDTDIHHKNGIVIDNSPENLEAITPEEHQQLHSSESANSSSVY